MAYEIYQREFLRASTPTVTLNRRGLIVLNVAATKIFHDAGIDHVFLLWDSQQRKFALKETTKKDPRTVKVRYSSNSKWAAVSAKGFLQVVGHDTDKTVAYSATWNEDERMLEVAMGRQEVPPLHESKHEEPKRKIANRAPVLRQQAAAR
jgi:hypothetical protein